MRTPFAPLAAAPARAADGSVAWIDSARELAQKYKAVWTMEVSDLRIGVDCSTALAPLELHNVEDADAPMVKTHPACDETERWQRWS